MTLATIVGLAVAATLGAIGSALEQQYRRRPGNDLTLSPGDWQLQKLSPTHYQLQGRLTFTNQTDRLEIMVPEVEAKTKLLSGHDLEAVTWTTQLQCQHPDSPPRADGYWYAYIVKARKQTQLQIQVDIQGPTPALEALKAAWIRVQYITYGPQGRIPKTQPVVVPLRYPDPQQPLIPRQSTQGAQVFPIPTHLLTAIDDPVAVIQRYVKPHAQPGDVVTIGETPLAIMQGRFRHPSEVQPGWLARRICYYFLPTSSLATACGMQTLVDLVGTPRVLLAFIGGVILRVFGQRGGFYQLAGDQARLIDDVTGTLPPYDQYIVLGPEDPQSVVNQISQTTGLGCAIVDVNDLKAVKVLAASSGVSESFLQEALLNNPAGNADEQTPIVLLRPQ